MLERIPEYSEDIYPYATFHLPDQENMAGNPAIMLKPSGGNASTGIYDTKDQVGSIYIYKFFILTIKITFYF